MTQQSHDQEEKKNMSRAWTGGSDPPLPAVAPTGSTAANNEVA